MNPSDRAPRSRVARAVGLLLVLGMPLTMVTPLAPGAPTSHVDDLAGPPATDSAAVSAAAELDGYTAAAPLAPLPSFDSIEIRESDPSTGATPVTSIVNDPRCGGGFTSAGITGEDAFACFHTAADPLPEIATPLAQAATAAPVCMGNGVNGPRLQLLYMYVEGQPDRTALMVPRILNEFVPRMEGVIRETSKLQGREIGMRLHMPNCNLSVDTLMIDAENGAPADTQTVHTRITDEMRRSGYNTTDRKYILWFDGGNQGACGSAPAYSAVAPVGTDTPGVNASDIGWQDLMPLGETSVIYRYGTPTLGGNPADLSGCWGRGGTGARTEVHELIHNLGAVNLSAPNSNGLGHCTDDHDIMCYGEAGVSTVPRCASPVELLDCGADDYFNARPTAGSYLSTHWNTASSRFLGAAIVHDAVPVEIPRP